MSESEQAVESDNVMAQAIGTAQTEANEGGKGESSFNVLQHPLEPFDYDAAIDEYEKGIAQDERDLNDAFAELDRLLTSHRAQVVRGATLKRNQDEQELRIHREKLVVKEREAEREREKIVQVLTSISADVREFAGQQDDKSA